MTQKKDECVHTHTERVSIQMQELVVEKLTKLNKLKRMCIQMQELVAEKRRLEEVAAQQRQDLLRLRSVLLQVCVCAPSMCSL